MIKTVYREQPGLRPLGDLDLLVRAEDLPGVEEVLRLHGFRPLVPSSSFFHNGAAAFDLHTDLIGAGRIRGRALAFHFDQETLWQEALPLDPQDPTLLVLSPRHQLLHLVVHALKHSFTRLIWFIDLGLALRQVQWGESIDHAKAVGALRALTYTLLALRALMGVQIPSETLRELSRLNRLEHLFVQQVISRNPRQALGEVMVALSIPGVIGKLSYLFEFGFPRQEILAEVSPSTPAWLLYPQRLCHIMARGVREGSSLWRS
ncbi:MAG: nucleotidyltransferase family protein [Deltaproteobacteria bacterium]|nr:nucleotidyltransferase family protein [Deltaproteobacteria bacterium]